MDSKNMVLRVFAFLGLILSAFFILVVLHNYRAKNAPKLEEAFYDLRCQKAFELPIPIYRCVNTEVTCYHTSVDGQIHCKFK